MKTFINILGILLIALSYTPAAAQDTTQLYRNITHMDSVMFNAFNTQNLDGLKTVFAENLEFFHDRGGLSDYTSSIESFRKMFAANAAHPLRRELLKGTLEVYPVPGYGAVETGVHRFIHTENGKEVIGIYKFTQIWQHKDNQWKVTRVVSLGH